MCAKYGKMLVLLIILLNSIFLCQSVDILCITIYTEKVKEGTETGSFDTYLKSEMDKQIGYAGSFDGMITEYKGNNPIYMSAEQKAEAKKYQDMYNRLLG